MDPRQYVSDRINLIKEDAEELRQVAEETHDFDSWTALKLILQSSTVNMFTKVASSEKNSFKHYYYIDALAGNGISTYDGGKGEDAFLGSPLLAIKSVFYHAQPFSKMYFIEENEDFAAALDDRLEYAFSELGYPEPDDGWEIYIGDTNKEIQKVKEDIYGHRTGNFLYCCFIDNQGLDFKWDGIEEITPKPWGDLLINLPTRNPIQRVAGWNSPPKKLDEFYGLDFSGHDLPEDKLGNHMRDLYRERIENQGREITVSTDIDASVGSYGYDLIYATRETPGDNGYEKVIKYVKSMIENVDADDVDEILDILYGPQESFEELLPEDNADVAAQLPDEEPESEIPVANDQSQLGRWSN